MQLTIVVLAAVLGISSAGIVPAAVAAAPVIAAAPAPIVAAAPAPVVAAPVFGYAKAVPQNIPPHASRIDISTRNLAAPYIAAPAAPYIAAPAAPYIAAPAAAPVIAAPAAAPYVAAPAARLAYNPFAVSAGLVDPAYAAYGAAVLG